MTASIKPTAADVLRAEAVVIGYGARPILHDLTLDVGSGTTLALVGPNGSGKSTLLKALARLLAPTAGRVWLDGEPIDGTPPRRIARRLAVLPQSPVTPHGLTVREVVEQGRHPHRGALRGMSVDDHAAVDEALAVTGLGAMANRAVDRLSGGERQRVWIALTVVVVLHDLNQAARHADRMVVLSGGRIVADGAPAGVLTERLCASVFGAQVTVITDPVTGTPVCLPHSPAARAPQDR